MNSAQSKAIGYIKALREENTAKQERGEEISPLFNGDYETPHFSLTQSFLIKALASHAILEWKGVLTAEGCHIAPLTEQTIHDLMDIWFIAQEFWKQYMGSISLLEIEGNDLGIRL
jgi:hypothetical protein